MSLEEYKKKRKFNKTPEPKGEIKKKKKNLFVVQKHNASNLHYDFRIELNGVLKSWAVPKGPSLNPSQRRLAVETEDHPIDYAEFEGVIPEDEYGGGYVIVWDLGTFKNITKKDDKEISLNQAYDDGHITILLNGTRLKGEFALIKTKREDQWLLIKKGDSEANRDINIIEEYQDSVLSNKTIDDLKKAKKGNLDKFL
ncbi:MAG: DNA ligase D, 3'-phosphoesterase domain protein [Promethearchaeota archaeon]|nr:MAG: DNA ligase D, 3'-phosphoesterase domain protein [Candidatus Lokiarchaeota archaeon]